MKQFFLVFCVAAGMKYDINFGVRIPVGELLAFVSLPFLLQSIRWEYHRAPLFSAIAVLAIWAFAVCLSDFINGIPLSFFLKGLAKPIWCGLWMFFFMGVLCRDYRALYAYPAGLVIAGLQNYFFPQAWTSYSMSAGRYESIAFVVVPLLMPVFLSLSLYSYRRVPLLSAFVYLVGAVFFIYLGAPRSTVAISLLVFLVLTYMWSLRMRQIHVQRVPVSRVVFILLLFLGSSYAIFEIYVWVASNGWMGELQQKKLRLQSDTIFGGSLLGLILDGRTAVFAAILAIIDQPLIGFGSWQSNFLYEYYLEAFSLVGTNAADYKRLVSFGRLPGAGHSTLFGAWVDNGLLAALSLIMIGYWMFRELLNIVFKDNPLAPLFVSMGLFFFWGYFFSPFGVESRLVIGLFLALKVTGFCSHPPVKKSNLSRGNW